MSTPDAHPSAPVPVPAPRGADARRLPAVLRRWRAAAGALGPFARRHARRLAAGAVASVAVIGIRLTIPWLFRGMLKPLLSGNHNHRRLGLWLTNGTVEPTILFGALFLVLLVMMGFADFLARLKFAQFAIGTVRDLRARAFASAVQLDPRIRASGPGDLVARLIGDTARVKEGLKGFLTHVATNGALLVGICAVLLWVDPALGAILAAAVAAIMVVTLAGAVAVYRKAFKYRTKEGVLADAIQRGLRRSAADDSFHAINHASGEYEASVTRLQGRTTWATHAIFGLAVLAIVWVGMRAVADRRLATGDMLLFIMYVLMMRSPIVQLCRQGTRTGKILACADRLEQVLTTAAVAAAGPAVGPLRRSLRLDGVRIRRTKALGRARRLTVAALEVRAGERVAVVGAAGGGKSTLLAAIAGRTAVRRGTIAWDGADLSGAPAAARARQVAYAPQEPTWPKQPLWQVLGLTEPAADKTARKVLRKTGAKAVLKRIPGGLAARLASDRLSAGERRVLGMARAVSEGRAGRSVVLLDDPCAGMSPRGAGKRLRKVMNLLPADATVVVALPGLPEGAVFGRVIGLSNGKVVYDGAPEGWEAYRREAKATAAARRAARRAEPAGAVAAAAAPVTVAADVGGEVQCAD